ncbi:MAG: glycosyltransferase family 4 protein [Gemmatimonadetes bacterium]|nr:glycosyltransferase family 4 protein [Gemmatimonadota bacterium]
MRILIVTQYFWPENFRINDLAAGLVERGHEVTVLTGVPNYPGGRFFDGYGLFRRGREEFNGVRVHRVPLGPRGGAGGVRLGANYLSFALSASVLAPLAARGRFDVVFVYEPSPITVGIPALVLKRIKRAPVLFWVQDLWPESLSATGAVRSPRILRAVERLVRRIYRGSDLILVQSEAFAPSVARLAGGDERIRYFPNTAEAFYRPVPREAAAGLPPLPDGFRVMLAGNIGAAQDFGTVLAAAERLRDRPDVHWLVVGDGRMRQWVQEQVAARGLGGTVHLLGPHPPERMPGFFAHADVLLASLRRDPIFASTIPSKVQSYMACARPIIAALDGEGARVVEESGAGLACPASDPDALADRVRTLAALPAAERARMGERGRAYFLEHFEREMLLDRLNGWMEELVNGAAS